MRKGIVSYYKEKGVNIRNNDPSYRQAANAYEEVTAPAINGHLHRQDRIKLKNMVFQKLMTQVMGVQDFKAYLTASPEDQMGYLMTVLADFPFAAVLRTSLRRAAPAIMSYLAPKVKKYAKQLAPGLYEKVASNMPLIKSVGQAMQSAGVLPADFKFDDPPKDQLLSQLVPPTQGYSKGVSEPKHHQVQYMDRVDSKAVGAVLAPEYDTETRLYTGNADPYTYRVSGSAELSMVATSTTGASTIWIDPTRIAATYFSSAKAVPIGSFTPASWGVGPLYADASNYERLRLNSLRVTAIPV